MSDRIVVTGIGAVCSVAIGREELWESLSLGASGVDETPAHLQVDGRPEFAAPAMDFQVEDYLRSEKNYLDRHSELGFVATKLALDDAELTLPCERADCVGLALGTCWGNPDTMTTFYAKVLEKEPKFAPPILFPHAYPNTTTSLLSIEYEIKGPNANFTSGMTAGADALVWAVECLRRDRAEVMLVAGIDALSQFVLQGYTSRGQYGSDESLPFHEDRSGLIAGEGGAVLVMESAERAVARGGKPLAEVAGCGIGTGGDVTSRIRDAVSKAMGDAQVDRVDAVFAAANASGAFDEAEARALSEAFGERVGGIPVTALKAGLGETFAAAGPLHCAAAALGLSHGVIPPTAEVEEGRHLVPLVGEAQDADLTAVLVNVVDPGGSAVSFVLKRTD